MAGRYGAAFYFCESLAVDSGARRGASRQAQVYRADAGHAEQRGSQAIAN